MVTGTPAASSDPHVASGSAKTSFRTSLPQ